MQIIILYQHISREYQACQGLKNALNQRANVKASVYSVDFEWSVAYLQAKKNGLDVLIVPWLYDEENYQLFYPFIKLNQNLIIFNLHHEQIACSSNECMLQPRSDGAKNVFHCAWGDYFKSRLEISGVKSDKIFVTGNLRNDSAFLTNKSKKDLAQEYGLDINKKWIIFAESRGWALKCDEKLMNYYVNTGVLRADMEERLQLDLKSLTAFVSQLNTLKDDFFKQYEFIYRPHPGTAAPKQLNSKVKIISSETIYSWLKASDLYLTWNSTSIFEADILNIPALLHEPISNSAKHRAHGLEKYETITSFEQISKELLENCLCKQKDKKIYEEYFGIVDGNATARLAQCIIGLDNKTNTNQNVAINKQNRNFIYRKICFELVTYILGKMRLLKKLKFPRSAFYQYNDIPYLKK